MKSPSNIYLSRGAKGKHRRKPRKGNQIKVKRPRDRVRESVTQGEGIRHPKRVSYSTRSTLVVYSIGCGLLKQNKGECMQKLNYYQRKRKFLLVPLVGLLPCLRIFIKRRIKES